MKDKKTIIIDAIAQGMVVNMALDGLCKSFKRYGIEGTEQKIRELYKNTPKLRDLYLGYYNRTIKGGYDEVAKG